MKIKQNYKHIEELLNFEPIKQYAFVVLCNSYAWEIVNKYLDLDKTV